MRTEDVEKKVVNDMLKDRLASGEERKRNWFWWIGLKRCGMEYGWMKSGYG